MASNQEIYNTFSESSKLDDSIEMLGDIIESNGDVERIWYFIRAHKVLIAVKENFFRVDPDLIPNKNLSALGNHLSTIHSILELPNPITSVQGNHAANFHNAVEAIALTIIPYIKDSEFSDNIFSESYYQVFRANEKSLKSIVDDIKEVQEKLENDSSKAEAILSEVQEVKNRVQDYEAEMFGDENSEGLSVELQGKVDEIIEIYDKIESFDNKFHYGNDSENGIRQRILNAKDEAESDRNAIKDHLEDALDKLRTLDGYYDRVFGLEEGDGEQRRIGLKTEIEDRLKSIENYDKKQRELHSTLEQNIKELHEGAIKAGLATAYNKLKKSFDMPIRVASFTFFATMLAVLGLSVYFVVSSDADPSNATELLYVTLARMPFYLPLIWLALFTSKRRSEYARLKQEYAHKEALAISFESYKKQIAQLGEDNDELSKLLLASAIKTISYNASETLDKPHGDKHPVQETVNGVSNGLGSIMSRSKGTE